MATLLAGCDLSQPTTPGGKHLHVIATWIGDEQAAFMAMVKPWEDRTKNKVDYEASRDVNALLGARLQAGTAPDLAQLPGPGPMAELARSGKLLSLDKTVDLTRMKDDYGLRWLRLATVNGKLVSIFIKVAIEGLIFYDPKALAATGVDFSRPPSTWTELAAAANQIASTTQATPWCIGIESGAASGWPGTDWIRDFYLHQAGPAKYEAWAAGQQPWNSPEMKRAWQAFGAVVNDPKLAFGGKDYVLSTNFSTAFAPMFHSPPGCYLYHQASSITGDFRKLQPQNDLSGFGFPAVDPRYGGAQVVTADLFGMFKDSPEARDLIDYLTTAQAQQIWVRRGGALSPNRLVSQSAYPDAVSKEASRLILSADPPEFDLSSLQPAQQTAFFNGVVRYLTNPETLDSILNDLEKKRKNG